MVTCLRATERPCIYVGPLFTVDAIYEVNKQYTSGNVHVLGIKKPKVRLFSNPYLSFCF